MTWTPPARSEWVDHLNALGASLGDAGRQVVPLDAEQALQAAMDSTGLDDFGDGGFREGLRILVHALEEEAQLTLLGRMMARAEIARILESRLRTEKIFRDHPEIEEEEIVAPLFVTGLARTGTSLLHELLWRDPGNRAAITWEMMYPAAAVASSGEDVARTIACAEREVRMQDHIVPAMRTMHELGAELPNECIYIFAHEFASDMFTGFFQIPSYTMWKATTDPAPWYAYHRRFLKLLQWQRPRRRWVLKAPSHMNNLEHLFATYPDAHVILTHRDPLRVLGSLANLMASLQWMRSDDVHYQAVVQAMAFGYAYLPEKVMEQRDKGTLPADQIIDVRYQDLVADPIGSIRGVYERCGTPLAPEAEKLLAAWMKQRPKDRHGVHEYSFADTDLDLAAERPRHAAYQARFDIPSEV
jgi:Sulfotransferase domain.